MDETRRERLFVCSACPHGVTRIEAFLTLDIRPGTTPCGGGGGRARVTSTTAKVPMNTVILRKHIRNRKDVDAKYN